MQCPSCHHVNSAISVRCVQCRTTLIHEAEGSSDAAKVAAGYLDRRLIGFMGGFFGFALVAMTLKLILTDLWLSDHQIYTYSLGGALIGNAISRLYIWARNRGL